MDSAYQRKTALILYILLVFFLNVGTDAEDHAGKCPLLKVQRGTIHKVFINKTFRISCDLMYCNDQTINVTWTKVNLNKWIPVSEADQMSISQIHSSSDPNMLTSYLTFTNISKHHEGLYRCGLQLRNFSTHSHHINVSVSDNILEGEMTIERENTDSSSVSYPWWLPYLLICLGALILFVVIMLISILCINACRNSRRKNTQRAHIQYIATSVMSSPRPSVLKRDEFDSVYFSKETQQHSHDNTLSLKPGQSLSPVSDSNDDPLSNRRESRSSQVVYASLHHIAPTPLSSTTSRQTQEEFSEYASIRIRVS